MKQQVYVANCIEVGERFIVKFRTAETKSSSYQIKTDNKRSIIKTNSSKCYSKKTTTKKGSKTKSTSHF